jgi:hypothetical protein
MTVVEVTTSLIDMIRSGSRPLDCAAFTPTAKVGKRGAEEKCSTGPGVVFCVVQSHSRCYCCQFYPWTAYAHYVARVAPRSPAPRRVEPEPLFSFLIRFRLCQQQLTITRSSLSAPSSSSRTLLLSRSSPSLASTFKPKRAVHCHCHCHCHGCTVYPTPLDASYIRIKLDRWLQLIDRCASFKV